MVPRRTLLALDEVEQVWLTLLKVCLRGKKGGRGGVWTSVRSVQVSCTATRVDGNSAPTVIPELEDLCFLLLPFPVQLEYALLEVGHLVETIHVELSDEGAEVRVLEEPREELPPKLLARWDDKGLPRLCPPDERVRLGIVDHAVVCVCVCATNDASEIQLH